ncbi:MAG: NUDIX domain-containing protein [Chloroflexaceae bacterium]|nr:NUDIX domain-containing protein [Chloroflexaceae bacterium]
MTLITLETDNTAFALRAAGVALHEGHVLLQYDDGQWFLPGGRIELLELAETAIQREMQEELGVVVTVERLLWVFEGLTHRWGKTRHELSLAFLVTLPPGPVRDDKTQPILRPEQEWMMHFAWQPLARLAELTLFPPRLATWLQHLPEGICHYTDTTGQRGAA